MSSGVLLATAVSAFASEQGNGLPAEECVRLLREARIARMREDATAELQKLQTAHRDCPGEIAPIYGLLNYHRRQPGLEESHQQFLSLLTQRLRDWQDELPLGVIEYLIRNPEVADDELRAVLDRVSRQVSESAESDSGLMRIQAQLQERLGQTEAAAKTVEQLWQQDGSDDLFWPLFHLYSRLHRWQDAARLIAPRVEEDPFLRSPYLHVLGKLGRYDQVLKQVRLLTSGESPGQSIATESAGIETVIATVDFEQNPWLPGLLKQVAWDLRDNGQGVEAEQIFRGLLARFPDDVELQATVLNLYASEEERQSQAETLAQSWETETDANALFEEGTQRLTSGDAAGAIDLLRRAAPEFPELEAAWYNLGMAAYRLEDWPTVESAFGRASEIQPERAPSFFFRGLALEKLDRCGEAVDALKRALELDSERVLAHYYLASCYRKLGDQGAAAEAMSRYQAAKKD